MANLGLKESVVVITGAKGVGKTLLALSYLPPSQVGRVFLHDGEGSSNRAVEQLARQNMAFGHRENLDDRWRSLDLPGEADLLKRIRVGNLPWANSRERDSMIDYWNYILADLDENLTPGKFSVYVHDPIDRLESSMAAWVTENRDKAGWKRKAYGEMWTKGYYPLYRGFLSAIRDRGVDTIILTAHLSNPWTSEGPIPGKVRPKAKPELFLLSQFYVWVVNEPGNADGAPAGIVLKERLGTMDIDIATDRWVLKRRIPRRIPHLTWDDIQAYLSGERVCNLANPGPGESLTDEERSMIDVGLSDKQMQLMLLRANTTLEETKNASAPIIEQSDGQTITFNDLTAGKDDPKVLAKLMKSEGKTLEEIAATLEKPLVLVKSWFS